MYIKTAVLFLIFNRPDTTEKVFQAIRQAKPPRLYIAADGPRELNKEDAERVSKVREITTKIDWPCELKTLFSKNNLGCKYGPKTGIDWFFKQEEGGIILEDDCLPCPDFFRYCENLLEYYKYDERISVISGTKFQDGHWRGDFSYYFSHYNHVWGWASWRRAWLKNDPDINFWPEWRISKDWKNKIPYKYEQSYWKKIFDKVYDKKIESSWDYPWTASVWFCGGLTATPNINLVSNIGFGQDATHTMDPESKLANISTSTLGEITHPTIVERNIIADNYVMDNIFDGKYKQFPSSLFYFFVRLNNYLYRKIRK